MKCDLYFYIRLITFDQSEFENFKFPVLNKYPLSWVNSLMPSNLTEPDMPSFSLIFDIL